VIISKYDRKTLKMHRKGNKSFSGSFIEVRIAIFKLKREIIRVVINKLNFS